MIDVSTAPRPPRLRVRLKASRGDTEIAKNRNCASALHGSVV